MIFLALTDVWPLRPRISSPAASRLASTATCGSRKNNDLISVGSSDHDQAEAVGETLTIRAKWNWGISDVGCQLSTAMLVANAGFRHAALAPRGAGERVSGCMQGTRAPFSTRTMKGQQNAEDGKTSCNRTERLY